MIFLNEKGYVQEGNSWMYMQTICIFQVDNEMRGDQIDAYVVVYSVEDRRSFEAAINRLYEIRETTGKHVALILVANKTDLVRSRLVQEEGTSHHFNTKYFTNPTRFRNSSPSNTCSLPVHCGTIV